MEESKKPRLFGTLGGKAKIAHYFLEEEDPYSKRIGIRTKPLRWILGLTAGAFLLAILIFGGGPERPIKTEGAAPLPTSQPQASLANQGVALGQPGSPLQSGRSYSYGGMGGIASTRSRSANQVIRRGAGGNDPGATLPLGTGIPVRLINAILSTDSASPVVAEVTDDVSAHGMVSVPAGARAIGSAQYDSSSQRIQLRFNTFVYPEGDQHSVQAMGMMPDGSAGLAGDYHSGEGSRQAGRLLSRLVSGVADGMKNRQTGGPFGLSYEPGSVKNGILNGIALSAEDQATAFSENLSGAKPTMTLPSGQTFILFLEREYIP